MGFVGVCPSYQRNENIMEILIYTKRKCPDCTEVKQLLRAKNINYVEMDLESSPDLPHIFINGKRVDGLAGLQEALK